MEQTATHGTKNYLPTSGIPDDGIDDSVNLHQKFCAQAGAFTFIIGGRVIQFVFGKPMERDFRLF